MSAGRIACIRASALAVAAALLLVCLPAGLRAVDRPALPPGLREFVVPTDRPSLWPAGDWRPLSAEDYKTLLNDLAPRREEPPSVWIERAEYTATLVGNTLRGGRLSADVQRRGDGAALLFLNPLNPAVTELRWTTGDPESPSEEAAWGSTPEGRTVVLVDRETGRLTGGWSLRGHRLSQGADFDLQVAPALATVLRLRLPTGIRLEASAGDVAGPFPAEDDGFRLWIVHLGTQTRCRLTALGAQENAHARPLILGEHETSCVIREDGLHFQARIGLEVLNAPADALSVEVPDGLDVYSITYGDVPLSWKEVREPEGSRLQIQLPGPLLGRSRSLRIQALGPATLGQDWRLPRLLVKDAFLVSRNLYLEIERPLELQGLRLHGSRQTATVVREGQSESYTFEDYLPEARTLVRVGRPRVELSAQVVTHCAAGADEWSLTSDVRWSCKSGSTFSARIAVPAPWEITDVRDQNGSDGGHLLNWRFRRNAREGVLVLEFADSLDSGESATVQIVARSRADSLGTNGIPLPVLRPLRVQTTEAVLAVTHPPMEPVRVRNAEGFRTIDREDAPPYARDSSVWQDIARAEERRHLLLLHATNPAPGGELAFERTTHPFDARARVGVEFNENEAVTERVGVEISPKGDPIERVHLYFTSSGTPPRWSIADSAQGLIAAAKVPAARHSDWKLPAGGELWELRLASPTAQPFTITADRSRAVIPGDRLPLAFLPEAQIFDGTVELRGPRGRLPEIEARGAWRIDGGTPSSGFGGAARSPAVQQWRYRSAADELRVLALAADREAGRSAALRLRSRLAASGGGDHLHWATYQISETVSPRRFRFTLPRTSELILASLDGRPVSVSRQGSEYVLPVLSAGEAHEVQIHYRSPSAATGLLRTLQKVPVPAIRDPVLEFHFELAVPRDTALAGEPGGMHLDEPLHDLSWAERLFGPLGRSSGSGMFNPLAIDDWQRLAGGVESDSAPPHSASGAEFAPPDWAVYRASAPDLPDRLSVSLWHIRRARLVAWIALLASLFAGLVLRRYRVSGRTGIGAAWLSATLVAACILPLHWSGLAGAGFVGGLLGVLTPRGLISPRASGRVEGLSVGSTETFRHGTAILALLLAGAALLFTAAVRADDGPPRTLTTPEGARDLLALIPVEADGERDGSPSIVYVSKSLWDRWQALRNSAGADSPYLIASADYRSAVESQQSLSITARYKVALFGETGPTRVFLPITGAHLAGPQACRVNGKPHPVLPAGEDEGFAVELPAADQSAPESDRPVDAVADSRVDGGPSPRKHPPNLPIRTFEIELQLRAAVDKADGGGRSEIGIPPVAACRGEFLFPEPFPAVEVTGAKGELHRSADSRRVIAELGKLSRLQVAWSAEDKIAPSPNAEASVLALVEVEPARLHVRYRVTYRLKRGSLESVVWRIPREMVLRSVSADTAEPLLGSFLSPAGEETSNLLLEFAAPQSRDFTIDATFTLPVRPQGDQVVAPAIDLLADDPHCDSAGPAQIGFATTSLYRLEPQTAPSEEVSSASADAFYDSFLRSGGAATDIARPSLAYQLRRPTELRFRIVPVSPQRKIWLSQMLHLGSAELTWTATAEIETGAAPAFQHTLTVDPRLEIESISVQEDTVERLQRWTRDGERVVLYLNGKTIGVQTAVLRGRMSLRPGEPAPLPFLGVQDSEQVDSRLYLYRAPDVEVELANAGGLETLVGPLPSGTENAGHPAVGQYRLADGSAPPELLVRARPRQPVMDSLAVLERRADGTLHLELAMRFRRTSDGGQPLRLALPPELAHLDRVQALHASHRFETEADGSRVVLVEPQDAAGDVVVRLSAPIVPPDKRQWKLPTVSVADCRDGDAMLAIVPSNQFQPVAGSAASLGAEALPEWARAANMLSATGRSIQVYRGDSAAWVLRAGSGSAGTQSAVALVESELSFRQDGPVYGTTFLVLPPTPERRLNLHWPDGLRIRGLLADGRPQTPGKPDSGELVVPISASAVPRTLRIDWTGPRTGSRWPLQIVRPEIPFPKKTSVGRALLSMRAGEGAWTVRHTGLRKGTALQFELDRLDALLAACREVDADLLSGTPLWTTVRRLERQLAEELPEASDRNSSDRLSRRLARVRAQIDARSGDRAVERGERSDADASLVELTVRRPSGSGAILAGRLSDPASAVAPSFWILDRSVLDWGLLLIGLALAVPVSLKLVRSRPGEWLPAHPDAGLALLGVIWWIWLQPSVVGLLILLAAGVLAWRKRRAPAACTGC